MNRTLTVVAAVVVAVVVMGVVVMSVVGFGSSPRSERPDRAQMVDSGSWYQRGEGFWWPHDGHPYETEHFVVYSDGASLKARQRLAALAEEVLVEVVDEMGVDPATMFRFPPGQDKIDIYANRYNVLEGGGRGRITPGSSSGRSTVKWGMTRPMSGPSGSP